MQGKFLFKCAALAMSVGLLMGGCGSDKKDSKVIKIGALAESTGSNGSYGTAILNGMRLAVKEINEKGVLGKKLELVAVDTKSSADGAAKGMAKLVNDDKVDVASGIFASASAIAASEVSEAAKVPYLATGATNPAVTVGKDGKVKSYTFRACFIDPFQGDIGARFATDTLKAKKAAIYVDSSSEYAKGLAEHFKDSFVKRDGKIVAEYSYAQNETNFQVALTKIKATQPDVLYVPGYYEEVGRIIKQARAMDLNCAIVGGDGWDSPKLPEIASVRALNNTYFTNHFSPDAESAEVKSFVINYLKEYKQKPLACAVLGYDSVKLLADAIKRAGSTDGAKVAEALAATKSFKAVTGQLALDNNHDAVKSVAIIEYKDGRQVYKTTIEP